LSPLGSNRYTSAKPKFNLTHSAKSFQTLQEKKLTHS
jgi:hypothetical protein